MKKLNKKSLIYMVILIIGIGIYMLFTKENTKIDEENLIENVQNSNTEAKHTSKENSKIVVYITGAIKNPGVYELEEEKRVADLIEIAGGVTEESDTSNINLAYKLEDEMKVHIPTKTETQEENSNITSGTQEYNTTEKSNSERKEKININTASQTELETLPGIGPSTALKIIEYRKETGKFKSIEDIKNVKGIGDAKYEKVKNLIKV